MTDVTRQTSNVLDRRNYEARRIQSRPDPTVLELLRTIPPAFVSDYLKQIGIVNHTIRGVKPLAPMPAYRRHCAGTAFTMQMAPVSEAYPYTDAPYMHTEIVEQGEPGDILVIAGGGAPFGFWGDHTTHQAKNQRLEAVVIDGYTRDSRPIIETGFPVFSTGVTFESYVRRYDPVGYNVPVPCGGAMVRPGDVIVADDDGVVVIPVEVLEQVVEGVSSIADAENMLREAVADGRPWEEIYPEIHRRKYLS
jgi:4-hydroxy-4-methyl-2-oxoglutarate aldolase